MSTYNDFQPLRTLEDGVLAEIIREGENRLNAQLQVATAADQRALTLAGAQLTAATASLGGGIALARGNSPDLWLSCVAIIFAATLLIAAHLAIQSARPTEFNFPGNRPRYWLPERWLGTAAKDFSLKQAIIEQAACIEDAIVDNKAIMDRAAKKVHKSLDLSLAVTAVAAGLLLVTIIARNWTIAEPISEITRLHCQ